MLGFPARREDPRDRGVADRGVAVHSRRRRERDQSTPHGAIVLTLAALLTLTTFVYVGASGLQSNADRASEANDEVRELLTVALCAHRYMNALGQRTLIANNERRVAAARRGSSSR